MMFNRILFEKAEDVPEKVALEAPDFFADLNLDQIVDAITAGKEEYNLKPFFYTSLRSPLSRNISFKLRKASVCWRMSDPLPGKCAQCVNTLLKLASFTADTKSRVGFWMPFKFIVTPLLVWSMTYRSQS